MLHSFLFKIEDFRRKQAKQYELGYVLFFSILAILSNADSYRTIHTFIKVHFEELKKLFNLDWENVPAYTTIRNIIKGTKSESIEKAFRDYTTSLKDLKLNDNVVAIDGKVLKGSFDNFQDKKAIQILSAFLTKSKIVLAHEEIDSKTNEIPVAQALIEELELKNCIYTLDSLHCQKNFRNS